MTPAASGPEPPVATDDEHALRLLLDVWVKDGRITSAAFHTRSPRNPKYVPVSLFLKERIPDQDGNALHVERFASHGRARLVVERIRSLSRAVDGVEQPLEFDLLVNGSADPPLDAFGAAHANLVGPTHRPAAAKALAEAFNQHGVLEKAPA